MPKFFRFSEKNFPFFLFLMSILVYGLFIPWLGFYWDDWPVILMGKFFGVNAYADFYTYDRPFSAWTYLLALPLLGLRPLAWQIFTLLLRWLTGVFFWLTLRRIWPQHRLQTAWVAILFLVSPVFTLQFISVAFSQHWICALLYAFSLWAMLKALDSGRFSGLWLVAALTASALHLWTMEYFLGLEIFRYALLWRMAGAAAPFHRRLVTVLRAGWPFALALVVYVFWRLFLLQLPQDDPNPVRFLADLQASPLTGLLTLAQIVIRDLLYMLIQTWAEILSPARVELASKFFLLTAFGAALMAAGLNVYFGRESARTDSAPESGFTSAIFLGLLATLLGALPGWLTYRQALAQPYGNRIALPALLGLSMLTVGLLDWLLRRPAQKRMAISLLVGLAAFSHFYTANAYREMWNIQKQFYWQLAWRAPGLQSGTALLSDSEVVISAGTYSTASAINLIYADTFDVASFPYWFFNTSQSFKFQSERMAEGKNLRADFRTWHFVTRPENVLLVDNDSSACMRVLAPEQPENGQLSPLQQQFLPQSDLGRIVAHPAAPASLPSEIFGAEPAHAWCYYYQKAALARQQGDWAQVIRLGEQAAERGYQPANAADYLLFVDAYVQTGDLPGAVALTGQVNSRDPRLQPLLCQYWAQQPFSLAASSLQKLSCAPGS
ncbi:hypothetical protein GW781_12955 [bacterium]|nr:hypothetical protein [bacterium]NCT22047.1 hypothetical protein [bacterium]